MKEERSARIHGSHSGDRRQIRNAVSRSSREGDSVVFERLLQWISALLIVRFTWLPGSRSPTTALSVRAYQGQYQAKPPSRHGVSATKIHEDAGRV